MYNVSTNFLTAIKAAGRNVSKSRVDVGAISLTEQSIVDFTIESQLSTSSIFSIGGVVAAKLSITFVRDGFTPSYFTTQNIKPYACIEVTSGVFEYIPLGVFKPNIDEIKKTDKTIEVECYDAFTALEDFTYDSSLVFPQTIAAVLTEIQTNTGVTFKSMPTGTIKVKPVGTTRFVIGKIAELLTANAIVNRIGQIEFKLINSSPISLSADNYIDFKLISDDSVTISRIAAKQRGTDNQIDNSIYSGNETGFTLTLDNESITTQEELNVIYARAFPFTYYAYELNLQGMPHMDVGDTFVLTDIKGVVRTLPILAHKLSYNGGLRSSFKADAPKATSIASGSTGGGLITKSLNTLKLDVLTIDTLLAGNLTADNILANSITVDKMNADVFAAVDAHIGNLTVDKATVIDLAAMTLRTTNLEAFKANIDNLIAGNITAANIKAGTIVAGSTIIANGAIGNLQVSDLNAAKLNAGIVDTSKVTIQGTNGRLKLTGNRIQVFANKPDLSLYERVSVGDVNGDGTVYGLRVRGSDGTTTLMDETGVKREGITDGSVNNAKIGTDANINGSKLDIASVVTSVNNGTTTITSNKIAIDNSTLDLKFGTLATTVGGQGTTIATHTGEIAASNTAIGLKVASSTYNTKMAALDGINTTQNTTLGQHTTSIGLLDNAMLLKVTQTEVDVAQTSADNAVLDAATAQTAADAAQTTANDVGEIATGAVTRIESAEALIELNATNITSKVETTAFNSLSGIVSGHSTAIAQFDNKIVLSVKSVTDNLADANEQIAAINSHMTFDADGLVIGQENGITDNLKVQIKSTEMNFLDNGKTVAKITGQQMDIGKAKILTSLVVGQHVIETYNSDITLIKWIGSGV